MKLFDWFKKHPIAGTAIVGYTVAVIICGSIVINSYVQYQAYEKKYNADELALRLETGSVPAKVMVDDNYASRYKKQLSVGAEDLTINSLDGNNDKVVTDDNGTYITGMNNANGGEVSLDFTIDKDAFVDIDIVLASSLQKGDTITDTENLMKLVSFSVNDNRADGDVKLTVDEEEPEQNWHHLILKKVPVAAGDAKLAIASIGTNPNKSGTKVMPDIMSVTLYSGAKIA